MVELVCPRCRQPLAPEAQSLRCAGCAVDYPVVDGVADLLGDTGPVREEAPETDYYSPMRKRMDPLSVLVADRMFAEVRRAVAGAAEALGRKVDVVDIGSGNLLRGEGLRVGRMFGILLDHARSYVGIEPSWAMLRDVQVPGGPITRLPAARLVRATGEELPVRPASVDVVLCLAVLDHCVEPAQVLRRAHEALRPGGILVLTLHNRERWYRQLLRKVARSVDERLESGNHHHHQFTPAEVRALLVDGGFTVGKLRELGYLLVPKVKDVAGFVLRPLERGARARSARALGAIDGLLERAAPGRGQSFLLWARR